MLSGPCQSLVATNNTAQKLGRANGPNSCAAVSWPKARRGIGSSTPPPIGPRSLATPPTPRFPPSSSPHLVRRTPALPQPGSAYPRARPTTQRSVFIAAAAVYAAAPTLGCLVPSLGATICSWWRLPWCSLLPRHPWQRPRLPVAAHRAADPPAAPSARAPPAAGRGARRRRPGRRPRASTVPAAGSCSRRRRPSRHRARRIARSRPHRHRWRRTAPPLRSSRRPSPRLPRPPPPLVEADRAADPSADADGAGASRGWPGRRS